MQLYCKTVGGVLTVVASHADGDATPTSAYGEGVVALPYAGDADIGALLGNPLPDGVVTLADYAAARRYAIETSGVTVTIGGDKAVPMSTRREDRDGARDTLSAIMAGLRTDGARFKFADGVSRPATNDEMKTAIATAFGRVQAAYDLEGQIVAQTQGKKPTITDYAGVDAAFASASA